MRYEKDVTRLDRVSCPKLPTKTTDPTFSCPDSGAITKYYFTAPRVPMDIWGSEVTPKPRFMGLVLDHQVLKGTESKNHS